MTTQPTNTTCPICGADFDKRLGYIALNGAVLCSHICRLMENATTLRNAVEVEYLSERADDKVK
jgi:hypothetical protein